VPLKRLLILPCLLILSALALSACGGGSSDSTGGDSSSASSSGPEAQIEAVVQASAIDSDPANCTKTNTQKFDEQLAHEEGAGAIKGCESEAESGDVAADSVTVAKIEVKGQAATLEATVEGGLYDGQTIAIDAVEDGGEWKLDQVTKIVKLDSAALAATFKEQLGATGELSDEQVGCIADGIEGSSQTEVEELLLSGSTEPLVELATSCV
jgi:hypothetical protein